MSCKPFVVTIDFGTTVVPTKSDSDVIFCLQVLIVFVCFVALRPKPTAMVIAGRSVHLTTLFFLGKLEQAVNQ